MNIITKHIPLHRLHCNKGQIVGLPQNPRHITEENLNKLVTSMQVSPEMLELRELIVMPYNDDYIVIGGNMRLRAARILKMPTLPCKVLPTDTPTEKLCEYLIKDNNPFGDYDWDILANEWDDMPLQDWGVDMPDFSEPKEEKPKEAKSKETTCPICGATF